MTERPTGTVTFLFTDLEGSTRLWEEHPEAMRDALKRHDELLQEAVERYHGYLVKTTGDGIHAAFATADDAVAAAIAAQTSLTSETWDSTGALRVRMGLHTGAAELRDGDYYGPALNRAARLMAVAHGGQIVVSNATEELVRDALAPAIGIEDLGEHRLRDLGRPERVFQVNAPDLPSLFAPLRSLDTQRTNLPMQLTSFVGREAEVEEVKALLTDHRIVTLTGPGGVGKTRLAITVAAETIDRFADGAWLVELASIESLPVVDVVAAVLGIDLPQGRTIEDALLDAVRSRNALLVIDNCEHVVREVRRVAEILLREARGISILATSREGLRVAGEQLFSVPSLEDEAAVRLFADRASAADARFTLDDSEAPTAARVCDRLDGIPLAIELAAARVTMFGLEDLADRVEQRFRVLTGGRGRVERHQTLRAAIDWSHDLLTEEERTAFARLSVFAGGCTLDAAEAVIADADLAEDGVLDALSSLIDKSLVVVDRTRSLTRYAMLETIRQYGEERLVASGDAETVRRRHVQWCATFARTAGRGLYSSDERRWLERLEAEIDNLQVAVAWAVAIDDTECAMRIGGSFPRQAMARPLLGTAYLAEQAMVVRDANLHSARARVLAEAAWAANLRGDAATTQERLDRSIAETRSGARFAAAAYTYLLATAAWRWQGQPNEFVGYEIAKEGLELAEAAGDVVAANGLRTALACQAMLCFREDEAFEQAQRALADARSLQQPTLETAAQYAVGMALMTRDPGAAIASLVETAEQLRRLEIESEYDSAMILITALEARHGDARRGLETMRAQLGSQHQGFFRSAGPYIGVELFNRVGRPDLVALCDGFWFHLGFTAPPFYATFHDPAVIEARAALGDDAFERHSREASTMDTDTFIARLLEAIDQLLSDLPAER